MVAFATIIEIDTNRKMPFKVQSINNPLCPTAGLWSPLRRGLRSYVVKVNLVLMVPKGICHLHGKKDVKAADVVDQGVLHVKSSICLLFIPLLNLNFEWTNIPL